MSMPESASPSGEVPSVQEDDLVRVVNPTEDVTESDEGLLLDSDNENNSSAKGQSPVQQDCKVDGYHYGDEGELDYDELMMDNRPQSKEDEDEDEVKVHAIEDIEEGEVSSDEEGEIKESDDESNVTDNDKMDDNRHMSKPHPRGDRPHPSNSESSEATKGTKLKQSKDGTRQKSATKKKRKKNVKGKSSGSEDGADSSSNEERDERKVDAIERAEKRGGARERRGRPDSPDKVPTPCRHFMGGKCNWGNSCRFLHEKPKDIHKLSLHDRHGDSDIHGMLADGPRGMPMGFPPGTGPMGHGIPPHGAPPPFMHGPGAMGLGHVHDLPMHIDLMSGTRGHVPLPSHGGPVRGFGPPPHMRGPHAFVPMHERDLPPTRPFELGRAPGRISEGQMSRESPFPTFSGGPRKSGKIAEVTEETDGWMRLRTVTQDWSSDEENGERVEIDLRDKLMIKRGGKDSNSDHDGKTRQVKGTPEEWADPWARDKRKEREKTVKTQKVPQKYNLSEDSPSSDNEQKMVKMKEMSKARKNARSPPPSKGRKRAELDSCEEARSSGGEDRSKKMKIKKSPSVKSKRAKKKQNETSSEVDSEQDSRGGREVRKRKQDVAKKRKRRSREDETSSNEEGRKKTSRSKHPHTRDSVSPTDDPRRFGNLRGDYFRTRLFPPHLPPEEFRPWPSPHHSFEDRMFPRGVPHPRDHAPSFPHETDRFGRDISKREEYEDTRRYRHTDRHLPPAYPSREGGFQDEYPPLPGRRAGGAGIPWDSRGRIHPFHDGPPMIKRRRSSEDASRSPTPIADMLSNSDSSVEPELSKSSSHRHYKSGPFSSEGHTHHGQPGKDKSKASRQIKSSDGEKMKHLSRKEKLLQELYAINKVIEKKKSKKRYH